MPGLVHEAVLASSTEDVLGATAAWLREGLNAGEDAVVLCTGEHSDALAEALDDARVTVMDHQEIYRKPIQTLDLVREFVLDRVATGSSRIRLVGEVDFGSAGDRWQDWRDCEALGN
jgi:hypothetical protein